MFRQMKLSMKPEQRYVSDWETSQKQTNQLPLEDQWITPSTQNNFIMPSTESSGVGLSGTSQIIEANNTNFSFASKCISCGYDFTEFTGKIYICKECGVPYHENCLNFTHLLALQRWWSRENPI